MGGQDSLSHIKLWELLRQKVREEGLPPAFEAGVRKIWDHGVNLSKTIICFFPTFTLHDGVHIANVCDWMYRLLGSKRNDLKAVEVALLLLAASCHDIGMSVSEEQKEELQANSQNLDWRMYFRDNPKDEIEFRKMGKLSDRMLRSFVRLHHHERTEMQLISVDWPDGLSGAGLDLETLVRLCRSHGEPLEDLRYSGFEEYDLCRCAVLLRMADILDFDASRAPQDLYHHLGLDRPTTDEAAFSTAEWDKHCTSLRFDPIKAETLPFRATCPNMQVEHNVRVYLEWVQKELDSCNQHLNRVNRVGKIQLPRKVEIEIVAEGYRSGEFCLTMDQDRILELLTGRNLYSDPGVFVRELLQNAIDAVHTRSKLDPWFKIEDGKIVIRTWMDGEGKSWFRIEDNGTGMDEHIITNYFLKVGRSYYESDAFKADMCKYSNGETYTPISRFGIGILSCFMCDPDHTLLEVSTKRFSQDPWQGNPAIRMNVTGLHGYYYLAKEGEQRTGPAFQPMHHPQNRDKGYRQEPGTTICVSVDLYRLGGYRSFKEIVDKYVQFPEITIQYIGRDGSVTYPTQGELMDAVHKLNPGGPGRAPQKYVHPISEEQFEQLEKCIPSITWEKEERPNITFQYYPLDYLDLGKDINGIYICVECDFGKFRPKFYDELINEIQQSVYINYDEQKIEMKCIIKIINIGQKNEKGEKDKRGKRRGRVERHTIEIQMSEFLKEFKYDEMNILKFVTTAYHNATPATPQNLMVYNGILAGASDNTKKGTKHFCVVLLKGSLRPDVPLGRETIELLPLEAQCALAFAQYKLPEFDILCTPCRQDFSNITENCMHGIFNKHKNYADIILNSYFAGTIRHFKKNSISDLFALAAWKERYCVFKDTSDDSFPYITEALTDHKTDSFPATMFFHSENENSPLGRVSSYYINYYNANHPFSCWLIQRQESLEKQVPVLYHELLKTMVLGTDRFEILRGVNEILDRLQSYQNNLFEISDSLFLQDSDLTEARQGTDPVLTD